MAIKWFKTKRFKWYEIAFEPIYPGMLGSKHTCEYKAMSLKGAMAQAKKDEQFTVAGMQVYRIAGLVKVID